MICINEELVIGGYYYIERSHGYYLLKITEISSDDTILGYYIKDDYYSYSSNLIGVEQFYNNYRLATKDEITHLNLCIRANKFIEYIPNEVDNYNMY